jgi:hypothetical protein
VPRSDGRGVPCDYVVLFSSCHCWLGGISSVLVFAFGPSAILPTVL